MKHLAVLDLETGGTNKKKNAIVEVALIAMDESLKLKSLTEYIIASSL